jgi:hypothetical protein
MSRGSRDSSRPSGKGGLLSGGLEEESCRPGPPSSAGLLLPVVRCSGLVEGPLGYCSPSVSSTLATRVSQTTGSAQGCSSKLSRLVHINARDRSRVEWELALRPGFSAQARMPPTARFAPRGERHGLLVLTAGPVPYFYRRNPTGPVAASQPD